MSQQYDQYLDKHKSNVKRAFEWIRDNLPDILLGTYDYEWQIYMAHDQSKTDEDEYIAYDTYFYGGNRSHKVVQDFNLAWLHHIHKNPHHWQYWILHHDDPKEDMTIMPMDYNYIIEMICDWWSFSWISGDLKAINNWYDERKDHIKLHPQTRSIVEDILKQITEKLDENVG